MFSVNIKKKNGLLSLTTSCDKTNLKLLKVRNPQYF